MYVRASAPLSIGGVIDDSIRLYRASFSKCWVPALLTSLLNGAIGIWLSYRLAGIATDAGSRANALAMLSSYREPPVMGAYLLQWLLGLGLYGALFVAQDSATGGQVRTLGEAFGVGFARIPRAVGASILFGLLLMVGFVLLLVPGFLFLGALCLWPVALYVDNAGAIQSLELSRELTRGHWWRTTTILGVAIIIIVVLSFVIGLVIGGSAVGFRHDLGLMTLVIQLITIGANVFYLPMYSAVLLAIYRDLKLRREGGDLAAKLGALSAS